MNCYYCDAKPVHKDSDGFVCVHKSECPILEIEVDKMVDNPSFKDRDSATIIERAIRKPFYG